MPQYADELYPGASLATSLGQSAALQSLSQAPGQALEMGLRIRDQRLREDQARQRAEAAARNEQRLITDRAEATLAGAYGGIAAEPMAAQASSQAPTSASGTTTTLAGAGRGEQPVWQMGMERRDEAARVQDAAGLGGLGSGWFGQGAQDIMAEGADVNPLARLNPDYASWGGEPSSVPGRLGLEGMQDPTWAAMSPEERGQLTAEYEDWYRRRELQGAGQRQAFEQQQAQKAAHAKSMAEGQARVAKMDMADQMYSVLGTSRRFSKDDAARRDASDIYATLVAGGAKPTEALSHISKIYKMDDTDLVQASSNLTAQTGKRKVDIGEAKKKATIANDRELLLKWRMAKGNQGEVMPGMDPDSELWLDEGAWATRAAEDLDPKTRQKIKVDLGIAPAGGSTGSIAEQRLDLAERRFAAATTDKERTAAARSINDELDSLVDEITRDYTLDADRKVVLQERVDVLRGRLAAGGGSGVATPPPPAEGGLGGDGGTKETAVEVGSTQEVVDRASELSGKWVQIAGTSRRFRLK